MALTHCGNPACGKLHLTEDTITGRYWCADHAPDRYPLIDWDDDLETEYTAYVYGPEGGDPGPCRIRVGCDHWGRWWIEDGDEDVTESHGPYASLAEAEDKQAELLAEYEKEEAKIADINRPRCVYGGCETKATTEDYEGDPCCEAHAQTTA